MSHELPHTITEYQAGLLAQIFRIIAKEINSDEDKAKLAPGEIGINYTEGAFYIKNPKTGELFSPNSVAHVKQILNKFDPETNLLNADLWNGTKLYTSINQLSPLSISYTPDTVIRQMESPSVLISPIKYVSYKALGYPSDNGIMLVFKVDEECVISHYYDCNGYGVYDGRYNQAKHLFIGWSIAGGALEPTNAKTISGGSAPEITLDVPIHDLMPLSVFVTDNIAPDAVLYVNGEPTGPFVNPDKTPITTQIGSNNTIRLIYDNKETCWVLLSPTDSLIANTVEIVRKRVDEITLDYDQKITDLNNRITTMKQDYLQRFSDMKREFDTAISELKARPGNIITYTSMYTEPIGNNDVINGIEHFDSRFDKLVVNYNQTVLRPSYDYEINGDDGIILKNDIRLAKDDVLQFIVVKQAVVPTA